MPNELKVWLDDVRPAPPGWTHVKTAEEAITLLDTEEVVELSLDHDLGSCRACDRQQAFNCPHNGTGWDVVDWMVRNRKWPKRKPQVHSMNPPAADRMRKAINRSYMEPEE